MKKMFKHYLAAACVAVGAFATIAGAAEKIDYPANTVRLFVPAAPGAGTDAMARLYAREFEALTGSTVVVVNQSGGGGVVAFQSLVRAKPDGSTLLFYHTALHVAHVSGRSPFGAADMRPLATLGALNEAYVAPVNAPYDNLKELLDYVNKEGNSLAIGMQMGGTTQVKAQALARLAGKDRIRLVDGGSEAQRTPQLLGGQLQLGIMGVNSALQYEKSGDVKILGVASDKRDPAAPEWPTAKEQGVDLALPLVFALYAPKGMDPALVEKLDRMNTAIEQSENFQKGMRTVGVAPDFRTAQEAETYLLAEEARIKSLL